jgi:ABC-type uncharacterized transport system permease subunit
LEYLKAEDRSPGVEPISEILAGGLGFTLFTVGITTGFLIGQRVDWMQATWSIAVWCVYGGILIARVRHAVGGKWVATLSIAAFSLLLSTFWGIRFISDRPSF